MAERRGAIRSARALRRERAGAMSAARMAPLIDVVFLLLLYFLLAAQFRSEERFFRVDLPASRSAGAPDDPFALPERPISILVRSVGDAIDIRTDSPLIPSTPTAGALAGALSRARGVDLAEDQRFLIRAAPDARWEHTLEALNAVLTAGFEAVRFAEASP